MSDELKKQSRAPMVRWDRVPERFHYLRNVVLDNRPGDLGGARYDPKLERHIGPGETVTAEELSDLTRVYEELCRRNDNIAILEWLDDAFKAEKRTERDAAWYIQGLLFLFQELAELKVTPFSGRTIFTEKPGKRFPIARLTGPSVEHDCDAWLVAYGLGPQIEIVVTEEKGTEGTVVLSKEQAHELARALIAALDGMPTR
jgi:hypothetical protein